MNINNELTNRYFFSLTPLEQYPAVHQLNNTIILHHRHSLLLPVLVYLLLSQYNFDVITAFRKVSICCPGLYKY